ncbi:flavin reductase family protein [Streptomyces sp. 7R007]
MAVDAGRFRELFGSFPTSVSIVTTLDRTGEPRGFTCNAVSAVSVNPPLLLVCVDKGSRSLPALQHSGAFVVHVLADGGQDASERFAGKSADKFAGHAWRPSAVAGGAPVLSDIALGHAECTVVQRVEAGDHWILIGRVEAAEVFSRRPLLYHRRAYSVWDPAAELAGTRG